MPRRQNKRLLSLLEELYPDPRSELNFNNEYELVVAVVLSAQCTDKKVNEVTPALFARFPSFEQLAESALSEVERIIRPVNYYATKAKHLRALALKVRDEFGGRLPREMVLLRTLPGVGQKTANVVLSELGAAPADPVDTHVFRVAHRLGLATGSSPAKVELELCEAFPKSVWRPLHHWLIFHGRRVCKAQRPLCESCRLLSICPAGKEFVIERQLSEKEAAAADSGGVKRRPKSRPG